MRILANPIARTRKPHTRRSFTAPSPVAGHTNADAGQKTLPPSGSTRSPLTSRLSKRWMSIIRSCFDVIPLSDCRSKGGIEIRREWSIELPNKRDGSVALVALVARRTETPERSFLGSQPGEK
jgi:hypothetical protein